MSSFQFASTKPDRTHFFDGVHREPQDAVAARMLSKRSSPPPYGPDSELTGIPVSGFTSTCRIGKLTVMGASPNKRGMWHLKCDCGVEFEQPAGYIKARTDVNAMCPACRNPPRPEPVKTIREHRKPKFNVRQTGFTVAQLIAH